MIYSFEYDDIEVTRIFYRRNIVKYVEEYVSERVLCK